MNTKFAIFLPVRNGERYLGQALASIFEQTMTSWRLIVLENKSVDNTAAMLKTMEHPSMTVIPSDTALTITENWGRIGQCIEQEKLGDAFCTTIGHDDVLAPTFLATIDALVSKHPDASLYQTLFDLIDENGRLIRPCRPIPTSESSADFVAARCWGLRDSFGTGYVFRGADYLAVGGMPLFPRLLYADDLLFARLARFRYKTCAQTVECSYRLHRASTSSSLSVDLYEAGLGALTSYLAVLRQEWPEFVTSAPGASALAALLAREAMIFTTWPLKSLLSPPLSSRVQELAMQYERTARGVPFRSWLGSNFISREGYVFSKSAFLSLMYAKEALRSCKRTKKPAT